MCWETCAPHDSKPPTPRAKAIARLLLLALLTTALATTAATTTQAEINRDEYSNAHISMIVPEGWVLAEQKSYPELLVVAVRRDQPGRMNLIAIKLKPNTTAKSYCDRSRRTLDKLGFKTKRPLLHPTGAYIINAVSPKGDQRVRQAYRLHEGKIYVLTIAAPTALMAGYERGFDDAVRSMRFKKRRALPADAGPTPDANTP